MIEKTLTALLIEESPDFAELVQRGLAPTHGIEFVLHWTDLLMAGLSVSPKAVLMDLRRYNGGERRAF